MKHYENYPILALPATHPIRQRHLFRYHWACQWATGHVMDVACGYGYGSAMLERVAMGVVGVDRDSVAIKAAQDRHASPCLTFVCCDLEDIPLYNRLDAWQTDTIVSIETVEHLKDPSTFIQRLQEAAWRIILSTPIIPTRHKNPHHLHDFTENDVWAWFPEEAWIRQAATIQDETYLLICVDRKL